MESNNYMCIRYNYNSAKLVPTYDMIIINMENQYLSDWGHACKNNEAD